MTYFEHIHVRDMHNVRSSGGWTPDPAVFRLFPLGFLLRFLLVVPFTIARGKFICGASLLGLLFRRTRFTCFAICLHGHVNVVQTSNFPLVLVDRVRPQL